MNKTKETQNTTGGVTKEIIIPTFTEGELPTFTEGRKKRITPMFTEGELPSFT